jgi:hypothetical protein
MQKNALHCVFFGQSGAQTPGISRFSSFFAPLLRAAFSGARSSLRLSGQIAQLNHGA